MPSIEVNGKSYDTDEEGYLINLADWNMDVANYMAQQEKVTMTENHWEVVNFLIPLFSPFKNSFGLNENVCVYRMHGYLFGMD